MKESKRILRPILMVIIPMLLLSACGTNEGSSNGNNNQGDKKQKIVFVDAGWNSIRFHNKVASTILEEGYGYQTNVTTASMSIALEGLRRGDIDVYMEIWGDKMGKAYDKAIKQGEIKQVSINYGDTTRGFFVPTYMIKGDPDRGIKPMTPKLNSVKDLPRYWKIFKKASGTDKRPIIGAPPSWGASTALKQKMKTYNLDETYDYFSPGSGAGLNLSLEKAYKAGEPWVGYAYAPSWVLGKYDMTLLKEPAYDPKVWNKSYGTAFPSQDIPIAINAKLSQTAPQVVKFLSQYHTSSELTNEGLVYMEENDATAKEAANWWLKKHTDLWTQWVPDDVAKKVKKAL